MPEFFTLYLLDKKENGPEFVFPAGQNLFSEITHAAFGTFCLPCTADMNGEKESMIGIHPVMAEKLKLPFAGKTRVLVHEGILYLGPLIGIFTAGFTDSLLRPIGDRSLFFAKFMSLDQTAGMYTVVFGAHHINWEDGTVKGYLYSRDGWKELEVPIPNVVYDRLPNRKAENHKALKLVKRRLIEEYGIPWFNPGFFNKWDIHQTLVQLPETLTYLPETYFSPGIGKIEEMLSRYKSIYLKPANGSLGLGVYQLSYNAENECYICKYRDDAGQNKLRKYPSLEHFFKHSFEGRLLDAYLVQQGIELLRHGQQAVDFRIHTNKDAEGEWNVTAIAAKVAGRGSVTTHVNSGGMVKTLEELFEDPQERIRVFHSLTGAAILLSRRIDSSVPGLIGEIGFDLGLDQNGKVWLFEANSKPGRSIFSHPKLKDGDLLSRRQFLDYAMFLMRKSVQSPEDIVQ
ncbi:YheC/YheD family protein [Bacillus mangrovi]|uniref:YheC/YheD family protein n=1 Tax=Metabacillus mangrovi TaxID=1491830 RepID=A0A7X2S6M7_9BACI|nr:YheC/YheD family protein [Metabacillus mangrovi]MTH54617.1 YheC/YheD family protein [Metabacillus mangrovi]